MDKTIGIIGGGQLGKMLIQYCSTLSIKTKIYDLGIDIFLNYLEPEDSLSDRHILQLYKFIIFPIVCDINC